MLLLSWAGAQACAGDTSNDVGIYTLMSASTASMQFFTGGQPSTPDGATPGSLLCTLNMSGAVWSKTGNGVLTLTSAPSTAGSITGTGTVLWFRYFSGAAQTIQLFDGGIICGTTTGTGANWNATTYTLTPGTNPNWQAGALVGAMCSINGCQYYVASNTTSSAVMSGAGTAATNATTSTWIMGEIGGLSTQTWTGSGTFNLNIGSTITITPH